MDYGFQLSVRGRWVHGYVEVVSDGKAKPTPLWKIKDVWIRVRDNYRAAGVDDGEAIRKALYREHGFRIAAQWMDSQKITLHRSVREYHDWRREVG